MSVRPPHPAVAFFCRLEMFFEHSRLTFFLQSLVFALVGITIQGENLSTPQFYLRIECQQEEVDFINIKHDTKEKKRKKANKQTKTKTK